MKSNISGQDTNLQRYFFVFFQDQIVSPDEEFQSEPCIADTLNIEECIVSIGPMFVQSPGGGVESGSYCEVVNHWNSHVGVSFQTEC